MLEVVLKFLINRVCNKKCWRPSGLHDKVQILWYRIEVPCELSSLISSPRLSFCLINQHTSVT